MSQQPALAAEVANWLQQQGWSWHGEGSDYPPPPGIHENAPASASCPWFQGRQSPFEVVRGLEHATHRAAEKSRLAQLQGDTAAVFSFLKAGYREDRARFFSRCDSERHCISVATQEILIRKDKKKINKITLKAVNHWTRCPARLSKPDPGCKI